MSFSMSDNGTISILISLLCGAVMPSIKHEDKTETNEKNWSEDAQLVQQFKHGDRDG